MSVKRQDADTLNVEADIISPSKSLSIFCMRIRTMEQPFYIITEQRRVREKLDYLSEWERLLNNLDALRRTSKKMYSLTQELEAVLETVQSTGADTRSLKDKMNITALRLGLQPLPYRGDED
jgi:hypothetical protein